MLTFVKFLSAMLLAALAGCASSPIDTSAIQSLAAQSRVNSEKNQTPGQGVPPPPTVSIILENKTFLNLLEAELQRCEARADGFDLDSHKARSMNLGIAALGIIAGSIVVPSLAASGAAKSAIAAWGGVSGAANAAQLTLNSNGRSTDAAIRAQKQFATNVQNVMARLKNLSTENEAAAFIYELRMACTIGAPIPEGAQQNLGAPGT